MNLVNDRISTLKDCILLRKNLVPWRSRKSNAVTQSSCELLWI